MLRSVVLLSIALVCASGIAGQKQKKEDLLMEREEWNQGSILLSDETELKGLVMYNDNNGILSFQNGTESKSLTPRSVIAFEFFDEARQTQRVFYTLIMRIPKPMF